MPSQPSAVRLGVGQFLASRTEYLLYLSHTNFRIGGDLVFYTPYTRPILIVSVVLPASFLNHKYIGSAFQFIHNINQMYGISEL